MDDITALDAEGFATEVRSRFGVLPNFFCTAASAPGLIEELWGFAKSAYLDSPMPSLFKERLFVHLSRFCEVRYCIIRHVGFLVGEGRPAGDASVRPASIAQAIALLSRPVPDAKRLDHSLELLEAVTSPITIPESETELEGALFDALTILFIRPRDAERARFAIAHAVGEPTFEILVAFLAFIRTAHYWTETHPSLGYERDMVAVLQGQPDLARLMLDSSEAEWAHSGRALRRALEDLHATSGALRFSEERLSALTMATSDTLYRMSPDWKEMRSLEGRGFLSDLVTPEQNWMPRYIPADEQERVSAAIEHAVATNQVFELEHRVLRHDGATGWVVSRAVPIFDTNREVIEWVGTAIDITARKDAQEALQNADRHKDEFLATLAHELRNPLAPLRNGLQIAKLNSLPNTTLGRTIDMMDRQVNMLVHLVDDLLDVSRIASGKIQLRRGRVNLREVLAASAEASRGTIDAHGHLLVVGRCADDIIVDADFDRLTQVFANLLSNAAKYTEDGGTIGLQAHQEADEGVVSVTDTGVGIAGQDVAGIFDIFAQVPTHQSRADGGLGIGLALVRQLIELHGGSVHAASPGVGQGSTFTVRLPLIKPGARAASARDSATAESATVFGRRILVVDDNADAASSLAMILEQRGHQVMTASDGQQAVQQAVELHPDVVFLDLGMPRMDGFEAAQRLRALPDGAQMILIALTGRGHQKDVTRTRAAGFDHHLLKPVDPNSLENLFSRPIE